MTEHVWYCAKTNELSFFTKEISDDLLYMIGLLEDAGLARKNAVIYLGEL